MSIHTDEAKDMLGDFVQQAGKSFLVLNVTDVFGQPTKLKVTPADLAIFYATQAHHLGSGIRTLAGLHGDWRPISELSDLSLSWFKHINIEGMRTAAKKVGLVPRF